MQNFHQFDKNFWVTDTEIHYGTLSVAYDFSYSYCHAQFDGVYIYLAIVGLADVKILKLRQDLSTANSVTLKNNKKFLENCQLVLDTDTIGIYL